MYKVTKEDLKGQIGNFPIEVVQKMIERQVEQGNEADVTVFQTDRCNIVEHGGFDWDETIEGFTFWSKVADYKELEIFFQKYPKQVGTRVYYRGVFNRGEEIISELEKLGGNNSYGEYNGKDNKAYYFINPISHQIRQKSSESKYPSDDLPLDFLKSFYTEKFLPEVKPEVKSETIEIDGKKYNKQEILDRIKELKEVE